MVRQQISLIITLEWEYSIDGEKIITKMLFKMVLDKPAG